MRVALIGGPRFGLSEPTAGGLESLVADLARSLAADGHDVTVHAGCGRQATMVDGGVLSVPLMTAPFVPSSAARADVSMPPDRFMEEHHAYLFLSHRLRAERYDVIHNHSLHYLPPMFDLAVPMVHTLHCPPTPWLESAYACHARPTDIVVSVSETNARRWGAVVDEVVPNGVDVDRWERRVETKTGRLVWTGRLVPEKGPHLAIEAARRAGRPIDLAGPAHDRAYFEAEIRPRLGTDVCYLGHLGADALADLVGSAVVALVTPVWDEPYGLVVAEALAAGTPVAAFDRGAIAEILDPSSGVLASPGDVASLVRAIDAAMALDPADCRRRARRHCSLDAMVDRYLRLYRRVSCRPVAPA